MQDEEESQSEKPASETAAGAGQELVVPNPKLKLMDQVREVLRVKHYSIRTEQAYC